MTNTNWKDIAELVGITAIVASLVFVGLQMQQDRIHARAELGGGSFENVSSLRLQLTSAEFAETFAKVIEQPERLTSAEKIQFNGYLEAITLLIIRECYLVERELFSECTAMISDYAPYFFGNEYAQSWWRLQDISNFNFVPEWLDEAVREIDPDFNRRQLDALAP